MPQVGDSFKITLKKAHLEWGSYRHTNSRGIVYGEGYLKIPAKYARKFNITNSNSSNNNVYICNSGDGFLNETTVIASGSIRRGEIYAKQFQGSGDLKLLGGWYRHINAQIGDQVKIEFTSPTEILITKL